MATNGSRASRGAPPSLARRARTDARRGFAREQAREDGRSKVSEIQRSRLLMAAVAAVDELGYDGASVAHITRRARISRRTFYEQFDNREQCLLAVFESVVDRIASELDPAALEGLPWRERVRTGLWTILSFFDRDPALARVCVVQAQRGDLKLLARRQQVLDRLATEIDAGRKESVRGEKLGVLTGQAVVGGVVAVVYARLLDPTCRPGALGELFGELMAMIVLPYAGPEAARREQERTPPELSTAAALKRVGEAPMQTSTDPLAEVPMRLTYRTARVLQEVADRPGSSNRQIAERVEIHDQGQVSKLLARLQRIGLLTNTANGAPAKGDPNAWRLTERGEQVTRTIRAHSTSTTSNNTASTGTSAGTPDSREGR
jgi:AcrR family transcriptional regulator/DNA-binding MarR family transcriptional regulator